MICVTGADGTVGRELVEQLERENASIRTAHHSAEAAGRARARGRDAVVVDLNQPATVRAAFEGCEAVFLLGPNSPWQKSHGLRGTEARCSRRHGDSRNAPDSLRVSDSDGAFSVSRRPCRLSPRPANALDQVDLERNGIEAARAAGVHHIVKQSVMGAAEEAYILARVHRESERVIEASGLAWTFLRPNSFMQNALTFMTPTIKGESAFYSASGDARISQVDVRDIAAVAVKALTTPGHEGKAYTLTGPEALTYDEMAAQLSKALDRTIRHVSLPEEHLRAGMLAQGMPDGIVDRLIDLERLFREDGASLITDDIRRVTGREAGRFADYARETAATGVWVADAPPPAG